MLYSVEIQSHTQEYKHDGGSSKAVTAYGVRCCGTWCEQPFIYPTPFHSVVLIAHVSLEQGDRWYPADLRDNLIQQQESGHVRLRKPENRMDIKQTQWLNKRKPRR